MKQDRTYEVQGRGLFDRDFSGIGKRLVPPVVFFAVAFTIDMLTRQQYSAVWGSAAIIVSVVSLFPAVRPGLVAIGAYAAIWVGFNLVRAFAEDAGIAMAGAEAIAGWERSLFGGSLPSAAAQNALLDTNSTGAHDVLLSLVHASFFIVPFAVAGITWWEHRERFWTYTLATALTFALGLVGFLLLPTSPPWHAEPENITRVTQSVLSQTLGVSLDRATGGPAGAFGFEPNHLAAMPSVHVAATVLVYLLIRQFGQVPAILGAVYASLMTFGVVYLGEHYVLDAIGGWAIAITGWLLALRFPEGPELTRWYGNGGKTERMTLCGR